MMNTNGPYHHSSLERLGRRPTYSGADVLTLIILHLGHGFDNRPGYVPNAGLQVERGI